MAHFSELRRRLVIVAVSLLVFTIAIYFFSPYLIDFLLRPIEEFIPGGSANGVNIFDPVGGFVLRFKVSSVGAVMVTSPIWIWQFLAFFLPALKPNERKWVVPTFFAGVFLFIGGNIFCYFIILTPAFKWLIAKTAAFASIIADASKYIGVILMFELIFGFAFELPLVIFYLIVFNIVPYRKLRKSWRVVYITLMIVCAFATPDASPIPMLLLFAAMVGLYELSLGLARLALRRRIERQELEEQEESLAITESNEG